MKRINLLTDPRIAALYAGVPAAQLGEYTAFLQAFPYRNAMIDGVDWAWIANQRDADDMLVLSGALCAPEVSWTTISALAGKHRVIAPEYPPVNSMDALADGIAAILRREGVARAHVVGGSYGGFVAQVFARRHPAMTRSLVLSHTRPPWPDDSQRIRRVFVKIKQALSTRKKRPTWAA